MRRILVPLDGTDLSASIIDDAVRLAGRYGALVLMQAVNLPRGRASTPHNNQVDSEAAQEYLETVAEGLRARDVSVSTVANTTFDVAQAISGAARGTRADMIACATHSRGAIASLVWGSVAWQVLAHSPVPVLLRHPRASFEPSVPASARRILVPLDGSPLAETALGLAHTLAQEWHAPVDLVRVIPAQSSVSDQSAAKEYVFHLASGDPDTRGHVVSGDAVEEIVGFVQGAHVTDLVMASHGRSGVSRVFLGSVVYDVIHRLPLPVIVVPALAVEHTQVEKPVEEEEPELTPVG